MIRITYYLRRVPDDVSAGLKTGGTVWINPEFVARVVERGRKYLLITMSDGCEYLTDYDALTVLTGEKSHA